MDPLPFCFLLLIFIIFFIIGFVPWIWDAFGASCLKLRVFSLFFPPFLWSFCSRQIGHQKHNIPHELTWVSHFLSNPFLQFSPSLNLFPHDETPLDPILVHLEIWGASSSSSLFLSVCLSLALSAYVSNLDFPILILLIQLLITRSVKNHESGVHAESVSISSSIWVSCGTSICGIVGSCLDDIFIAVNCCCLSRCRLLQQWHRPVPAPSARVAEKCHQIFWPNCRMCFPRAPSWCSKC